MSYTPGLQVTACTRHRVRRVLSIPGEVRVAVGDVVAAEDVVAATAMPGPVYPVPLSKRLGVAPAEAPKCLLRELGERVEEGEVIARSPGLFGFFKKEYASQFTGTIESVSKVTGQMILRGDPQPVEVRAYLAGEVVTIQPDLGCEIESSAAVVQGIFGIGGEAYGELRMISPSPADPVVAADIPGDASGLVLVGGGRVESHALHRAIEAGAAALVAGGIDDEDLRDLLGYDLGVAITGTETVGLTLIITEGFGDIAMATRTFSLLQSLAGRRASVNGTTQIRAGVLRPEIVVPLDDETATPANLSGELVIGAPVRIIRDPYFGQLGEVAGLPHEPAKLESESKARVLEVQTGDGRTLVVPRANVELIES